MKSVYDLQLPAPAKLEERSRVALGPGLKVPIDVTCRHCGVRPNQTPGNTQGWLFEANGATCSPCRGK